MKIVVSRDTIGRVLGVLILTAATLLLSYLCTAWVWWEWNPGAWSALTRFAALMFVVLIAAMRRLSISVAPVPVEE